MSGSLPASVSGARADGDRIGGRVCFSRFRLIPSRIFYLAAMNHKECENKVYFGRLVGWWAGRLVGWSAGRLVGGRRWRWLARS